jgi:hypothetical protein
VVVHSPQQNILCPASFWNEPNERGLCNPHLKQLMVPIEPEPPKGEPDSFDLYRRPSLAIFVDSSLGICSFYELPGGSPMAEVVVVWFSRLLLSAQ